MSKTNFLSQSRLIRANNWPAGTENGPAISESRRSQKDRGPSNRISQISTQNVRLGTPEGPGGALLLVTDSRAKFRLRGFLCRQIISVAGRHLWGYVAYGRQFLYTSAGVWEIIQSNRIYFRAAM